MMTIKQTADFAGITVRTLQYYDRLDLLKPAYVAENGYRFYDEMNLKKLQQIMFFRELDLPLKRIKQIMENKQYNEKETLDAQKSILILKKKRLEKMINLIDNTLEGKRMSFKEFDSTEIEQYIMKYEREVEQRWGDTEQYMKSKAKAAAYSKVDWERIKKEADDIFNEFASYKNDKNKELSPCKLVKDWQEHINKYYYECSDEILLGLAEMYTADKRFSENIDRYEKGLAAYISEAIKECIRNK